MCCFVSCGGGGGTGNGGSGRPQETDTTSGHIVFETVVGQTPACAASPDWLNTVMQRQAAFLGLSVPDSVRYHWRPANDLPCDPGAIGCSDGLPIDIYAQPPDLVHELVHAIIASNADVANPPYFLNEAAAIALGGPDQAGQPAPNYDQLLDPMMDAKTLPFSDYPLAGDFGSYLLSTRGPGPFVDLLKQVHGGADAAAVRTAFLAVYGKSIDDLVTERRASGRIFTAYRLSFPECSLPPVPWSGTSWDDTITLDCANSGIGPLSNANPPAMHTFATIDVPSDGYYHATIAASAGSAALNRCTDGAREASVSFDSDASGSAQHEIFATLSQGIHFLTLEAEIGAPGQFAIHLEPASDAGNTHSVR